jgi:drug/metabolite transporter (DMT)-like permease
MEASRLGAAGHRCSGSPFDYAASLLPAPSATVMLAILGLASFSTALSYVVYFRLLASSGATNVLLVTLLVPVTAITLGTLVLGEQLELRSYAGMLLIGLSLVIIDGRFLRFLTASRE